MNAKNSHIPHSINERMNERFKSLRDFRRNGYNPIPDPRPLRLRRIPVSQRDKGAFIRWGEPEYKNANWEISVYHNPDKDPNYIAVAFEIIPPFE